MSEFDLTKIVILRWKSKYGQKSQTSEGERGKNWDKKSDIRFKSDLNFHNPLSRVWTVSIHTDPEIYRVMHPSALVPICRISASFSPACSHLLDFFIYLFNFFYSVGVCLFLHCFYAFLSNSLIWALAWRWLNEPESSGPMRTHHGQQMLAISVSASVWAPLI